MESGEEVDAQWLCSVAREVEVISLEPNDLNPLSVGLQLAPWQDSN